MCIVRPHRFTNITSKSKTAGGVAVASATPTVGQFINWKSPPSGAKSYFPQSKPEII